MYNINVLKIMKKILFVFALMLQTVIMKSQPMDVQFMWGKPQSVIIGGQEVKNYAAIIKTDLSKRDVVAKTTAFMMEYGFVNKDDLKLDEIDENTAEYSIPIIFPLTQFKNGMALECPMLVRATARFEFHENGKVMIVFQDMYNKLLGVYREALKNGSANINAYKEEASMILMTKSLIGKALIYAQTDAKQREEIYKQSAKYFENLSERVNVYVNMVSANEASWLDAQQIINQYEQYPVTGSKYIINYLQKCIEEKRLPSLADKRWTKQLRPCFDEMFKAVNFCLNGEIEGIAEDGNQTWALVNGMLLPTDQKIQNKYIKKQLSYYNQE